MNSRVQRKNLLVALVLAFLCERNEAAFGSTYTALTPTTSANGPLGVHFNSNNNKLAISEQGSNTIKFVQNGVTTTIASTSSVPINFPYGLWGDSAGNTFVANHFGHNIIKVDSNGQLSVFAGTGSAGNSGDGGLATIAKLNMPTWVCGDPSGNLIIVDYANSKIRKINKSDNKISTVVGTGTQGAQGDGGLAINAQLSSPVGLFVDNVGNYFIACWDNRVRWVNAATGIIKTLVGGGQNGATLSGVLTSNSAVAGPTGVWTDSKGNVYVADQSNNRIVVVAKENNYEKMYLLNTVTGAFGLSGDEATGRLFVGTYTGNGYITTLKDPAVVSAVPSAAPTTDSVVTPTASPSVLPSLTPTVVPSSAPSQGPTRTPTASPTASPSVTPTSVPSEAPTLAVPEYSLTVSAKSFKYFEVRVFTEANERVFPVSYELVDCPENAGAVIWGHESTPVTENTNTCVYGLPRHYWCECPALVNGNKPKLTLNFGGTVFDRVELLILDWVDGEMVVSDSANNIVLFSASRAGGPLAGEEFVGYDHLNLLQVAPSVVPTITPSSAPTTKPSWTPTTKPTIPSIVPTQTPTVVPTTTVPSAEPSVTPSSVPSAAPSFTAQYTITLTAKTFKYFEVRVYTHDNLRIFPVSYELEHCPENAGVAVWNEQTTEDTNTCVYGYPRNFWCQCATVADANPKLVLHMGHTVFDRVELLLLNWEDGEVTVTDEANHETFLSATHDGVGNEFVTFGNLNLEHVAAPVRRLLRGG